MYHIFCRLSFSVRIFLFANFGKEKPGKQFPFKQHPIICFYVIESSNFSRKLLSIKSNTSIPRTQTISSCTCTVLYNYQRPQTAASLFVRVGFFFTIKSTRLAVIPLWSKLKFKMPISAHNQRPLHLLLAKLKPLMTLNEYSLNRTIVS